LVCQSSLRWFISNCSGNENSLKLPRGEVYELLYAHNKNRKKALGHRTRLEDMTSAICHLSPNMALSWPFLRVTGTIELPQSLLNFFTRTLLKMSI
jgi:hypothetical protein